MANAKKKSKVGRKKSTDPKVQVSFYTNKSHVAKVGGMEAARELCIQTIENSKAKK